ncbi:DUF559 domain-containing protein [Microbacterium sp. CFH 31415]|uniref:endonuclease domain-containing protein n=1 Tax=Microbacterium sp. CFH 31415 TaxID=2921732 RepID=UPI001F141040|nr:DUF559 domain-containing protein [Microbacterium sp. CFH 31415]MCH6231419.1 DUF559 domain-containing protein [Microbacterium sp. CFH 31415]
MKTPDLERAKILDSIVLGYAELRLEFSRRRIDALLADGRIIRLRKGSYVGADCPPLLVEAARAGGRLDCVSLLRLLGVFVLESAGTHIQMDRTATRIPRKDARFVRHFRASGVVRRSLAADLVEAVAQACRCQSPRAAIATLDSVLHLGLLDEVGIAEVFARLPRRYQVLRELLDPRSESGPETLVRLLVRGLGLDIDLQVVLSGVGRVDLIVDGWLIIECDSEAHHSGWQARRRDSRRDLAAAALGFTTLRPIAEDIMYHPDTVVEAVRGLVAARRGAHNVGEPRTRTRGTR